MKFLIEIGGKTQPELIHSLDEARKSLVGGICHLNVCGCTDVIMSPATAEDEDEFRRQYVEAHPTPTTIWVRS